MRSIDVNTVDFFRLYNDKSVSLSEMCERLNITKSQAYIIRKRHNLPPRHLDDACQSRPDDPTPEEIEVRAAECRARRTGAEKTRTERAGRTRWTLPSYHFDGRDYTFT